MITNKGKTLYSATDITRWLGCAHASKLDAFLQTDSELQAWMCAQKSATEDSGRNLLPLAVTPTNSRCSKPLSTPA